MPRVTEAERKRFHNILDNSIDKMDNPKNSKKKHWSKILITALQKMINVENAELELAVVACYGYENIEEENKDLINLNIMMVDNLRGNK